MPTPAEGPDEINWHDGVLVDLRISGFAEGEQEFTLIVDLYPDADVHALRRRYRCIGTNVSRFVMSGDIGRILKNRSSGNIDLLRMEYTADTEILVVCLFGGTIEVEARSFRLMESTT
ncbi:hypothetical protein N2603_00290 [Bradyrhizobium huanghuaihaiense]|uniref:hypothetical protein n=1 Tax=Bradyrhizobium huanghuaihaiense TaxID=990078 RepID=UPI0021A9D81C|nr:hypothetical protein [Bradyrhizobium sp. CB3035]UWU76947.1 hypothetical protein N2603_00290 [Bradyrhizobium sp. CB3035]